MIEQEEKIWEKEREEMHELYRKLSEKTKIKFGITYLCVESFKQKEPYTGCWNVFTKGRKYYCHCPNQLADDHNCGTEIDYRHQDCFVPYND